MLESKDNLIEDLKKEVEYMKRQIEETKEYTAENHDDIAKINKDSAKLKIRIEEQRKLIESLRRDAGKAEKVKQMQKILEDKK